MGDGLLSTKKNAHEVWSIPNQDKRRRTSKVVQETLVTDLKMKKSQRGGPQSSNQTLFKRDPQIFKYS